MTELEQLKIKFFDTLMDAAPLQKKLQALESLRQTLMVRILELEPVPSELPVAKPQEEPACSPQEPAPS